MVQRRDGGVLHVGARDVRRSDRSGNDNANPSEPARVMDFAHWDCGPLRCFDIAPDGRFLVIGPEDEESLAAQEAFFPDRIRIVQNWFIELTEKVPVAP